MQTGASFPLARDTGLIRTALPSGESRNPHLRNELRNSCPPGPCGVSLCQPSPPRKNSRNRLPGGDWKSRSEPPPIFVRSVTPPAISHASNNSRRAQPGTVTRVFLSLTVAATAENITKIASLLFPLHASRPRSGASPRTSAAKSRLPKFSGKNSRSRAEDLYHGENLISVR